VECRPRVHRGTVFFGALGCVAGGPNFTGGGGSLGKGAPGTEPRAGPGAGGYVFVFYLFSCK